MAFRRARARRVVLIFMSLLVGRLVAEPGQASAVPRWTLATPMLRSRATFRTL
jgi:hypothetical protein